MSLKSDTSGIISKSISKDGARRRALLFVLGAAFLFTFFSMCNSALAETTYTISDDATGGQCSLIGTWDSGTKTCKIISDSADLLIIIGSDGVTLDGNGRTMDGSSTYDLGCDVMPGPAVDIGGRNGVTVKNLNIIGYRVGISVYNSHNNTVTNNRIANVGEFSISLFNTYGNTISGNYIGSSSANPAGCSPMGLDIYYSNNNLISDNYISFVHGPHLWDSSNNILTRNVFSNNLNGLYLNDGSSNNTIYNNGFSDNREQVVNYGSGNVFNLPEPTGGNYWSDWTGPDANTDLFVDNPYIFLGGQDNLPLKIDGCWSFCSDNIAPSVASIKPATVYGSSAQIVIEFSDPVPSSHINSSAVTVTLDGSVLSGCYGTETRYCNVSGLTPGTHTIGGSVSDYMGNTGPISGSFQVVNVDSAAPLVTYGGPSGILRTGKVTISASFTDPDPSAGVSSASITLTGPRYVSQSCIRSGSPSGTVSCTVTNLPPGHYDAVVSVRDSVSNIGTTSGSFEVSPFMIRDDANGGECPLVGVWDAATKTCSLTTDINVAPYITGVEIVGDGITLDGNGHTVSGSLGQLGSSGVRTYSNGVTIKNLTVSSLTGGGILANGSDSHVMNNNLINNATGVGSTGSRNTISGNNMTGNREGVLLGDMLGTAGMGNSITGNVINASSGSGIVVYFCSYTNVISNNDISGSAYAGINILASGYNTIRSNTITSSGQFGILLSGFNFMHTVLYPADNQIYNNNFINNRTQADVSLSGVGNLFNLPVPDGGNYWSDWTAPDDNSDGVVDSPYIFTGGQDSLPWTGQDEWLQPHDATAPAVSNVQPAGTIFSSSNIISADYSDTESGINTGSVAVALDGTALAGCTVSAGSVSCLVSGLAYGSHTISVSVSDNAGNTSQISGSFNVGDNGAPVIDSLTADMANINAAYHDPDPSSGIASVVVTADGAPVSGCTTATGNISCPNPVLNIYGDHIIAIAVTDSVGNMASSNVPWMVPDTMAPQILWLNAPAAYPPVYSTGIMIAFGFQDAESGIDRSSVSVKLDGSPLSNDGSPTSNCSMPAGMNFIVCNANGLAYGPHSYSLSVSDNAGNTSQRSGNFSLGDNQAPHITWTYIDPSVLQAYFSDPPYPAPSSGIASVVTTVDGNLVVGCTISSSSVECPTPAGLSYGNHIVVFSVTDNVGLSGSDTCNLFIPDATSPVLSNVLPTGTISSSSITVSIDYSDTGSGINTASVAVKLDDVALTGCTALATSVRCPVSGLSYGSHTIGGSVTDNAGNTGQISGGFSYARYSQVIISEPKDGSTFSLGKTVTIKLKLVDKNGWYVKDGRARLYLSKMTNGVPGPELTAIPANSSYKSNWFSRNDYVYSYDLSTKPLSKGTWRLRILLDDGTSRYISINLR